MKKHMDTITAVLQNLKEKGQYNECSFDKKGSVILNGKLYRKGEIKIIRTYRFEGESDPGDEAIIYLLKTRDGEIGYCIDGYGMYTSHTNDPHSEFIHHTQVVMRGPAHGG